MTKHRILTAALDLSNQDSSGWIRLTRAQVAHHAHCAPSLVSYYFGTVDMLKTAVMERAVRGGLVTVIAQGRIMHHPEVNHVQSL